MLCIVFDGSPSMPEARCRLFKPKENGKVESPAIGAGLFLLGGSMGDILTAAMAYTNLLDVEYKFILGRKKKTVSLSVFFEEAQFFHLAGLHYLTDRITLLCGDRSQLFRKIMTGAITVHQIESSSFYPEIKDRIDYLAFLEAVMDCNRTVFKYNPQLEAFSAIEADFLLKTEVEARNVFTFLSREKSSGEYICRSFFPQSDKDYSRNQTTWTLLYKKKVQKSTGREEVLFDKLRK